jgi:dipeptidyl aminopeptidase/acylaminoacyl peptidase
LQSKKISSYGTWRSPVTSDLVASVSNFVSELLLGENNKIFWLERRSKEQGRNIIMSVGKDGQANDLIPKGFNARTRVHEYGGASYTVFGNKVYFANFSDQRVYAQSLSGNESPKQITSQNDVFYADLSIDGPRNRMICVYEDHRQKGQEATNSIASIDLGREGEEHILISGNDFYSSPRISPDGKRIAYLTWNHPLMPFFGTELWVADILRNGEIGQKEKIAGGADESICEPLWSPGGKLYFVSDRSGWWNIYRILEGKSELLCNMDAEFARPHWVFGFSSYSFVSKDEIICSYTHDGTWHLARLDTDRKSIEEIKLPYSDIQYVRANEKSAFFIAGSPSVQPSVVRLDLDSLEHSTLYSPDTSDAIPSRFLSLPEPIEFPTTGGLTAKGLYYAPKNGDYEAPKDELPPLMVLSHGGPTSATRTYLNPEIQFWTSRGFAILDVNYGGSTGYGREYRMRLNGQWGVVDVDDCTNGALFLVSTRKVDEKRLVIAGGSAGGYTTLCALVFRKTFKAGASYFGVSELEIFAHDTHKFESRYLETLVGPYPEKRKLYQERSPINYAEKINAPVIFFQGLEDKVVPPKQAEIMFDSLKKRGIPTAYIPFEGEQHGFRQAKNIKRANEAELYFYSKVFGFEPADKIEPVEIENMNSLR